MATLTLSPEEEAQLQQTIEMFEVIVQSQPNDCQSLEILKEAYSKLGREPDVVNTSKRIAHAYMESGQLSSAILEFETVLQRCPDDADVQAALKQIEDRASNMGGQAGGVESAAMTVPPDGAKGAAKRDNASVNGGIDDGRKLMRKFFVDSKVISAGDFDLCWHNVDAMMSPTEAVPPFIQVLHEKGILQLDQSLKVLVEKSRTAYLPLEHYDVDIDLLRGFPMATCRRWCVVPFDRMSKAVLVATANPFNQQAAKEIAAATSHRLVWYLSPPSDLLANLRKAFR